MNPISPKNTPPKTALVVIDLQYDFCENGALAVKDANTVIPHINELIEKENYDEIVFSQDFHPADHISFAVNNEGKKVGEFIQLPNGTEQIMWPAHCVQGTRGADFHHDVNPPSQFKIIQKGMNKMVDSYSAFYDNNHEIATGLNDYLVEKEITHIELVGLALDYCVKFTALDAKALGFHCTLHYRGTKAVNLQEQDGDQTILELIRNGIDIKA